MSKIKFKAIKKLQYCYTIITITKTCLIQFLLWVIELLLYQGKDCRDHIFGKYLTNNGERHAYFYQICALKILQRHQQISISVYKHPPHPMCNLPVPVRGGFGDPGSTAAIQTHLT